ncbi:MAG: histidinol dehydrogenase [Gammaproteobacteria bacterium]|nr:histidinol dehydrogenase [Gammaproteobacteria bacterium]
MKRLSSSSHDFDVQLRSLTAWSETEDKAVLNAVDEIIDAVIARGDEALIEYSHQLDGLTVASAAQLELPQSRLQQARASIPEEQRSALEVAAARIRNYHEHQFQESWNFRDASGTLLGQQITALQRVGVYVPGGKASYPSSVLMNVIPAKVAGVEEIVMVVPAPTGKLSDLVLAAAAIAGVDRVFTLGGAQAIAALAYGTETVPRVDKIVGPGNIYVATAKRRVFGQVGIDMIAGPSEIMVICDGLSNPDWIAMDLFSQAEHDENAQAILLSPEAEFLDAVEASMERLLPTMSRRDIITAALEGRGAMIRTRDLDEAVAIANRVAPEHLELSVADPEQLLPGVRHAGAIFMGRYTSEVLGDYCAGPNHVLPTAGTARFSSPLGVYDFQKRSSIIMCSPAAVAELAPVAAILARGESLDAHARSAEYRLQDPGRVES